MNVSLDGANYVTQLETLQSNEGALEQLRKAIVSWFWFSFAG